MSSGGMKVLNKIYEFVQGARLFLNIFCDDKFEQLEVDWRVYYKFDNRKGETVIWLCT
jgi:hypothetical protein